MSFQINEGSSKTVAADVYGAAAAPSSGQQVQWVGVAPGTAGALAPAANTNPLHITRATDIISVTLTLDTSAYTAGDLLADAQAVASASLTSGSGGVLVSMMVIDEDDQGAAFDVYLTSDSSTWGTENSAPTITDAVARGIQAMIAVGTSDYKDLGGVRVASFKNIQAVYETSGGTSLYVAVVNGAGTPTYTASGVKLVFGFQKN